MRITYVVPDNLYTGLKALAEQENRTVTGQLNYLLRQHLTRQCLTETAQAELAAKLTDLQSLLRARADKLRSTADELRQGVIHPAHAANRILKITNEISRRK